MARFCHMGENVGLSTKRKSFVINEDVDYGYVDCVFGDVACQDICTLWNKLVDYATYWELHSPTCNGNLDFVALENFIKGFLSAKRWEIEETDTKIIIKNRRKAIIQMTKRPKPNSYYDALKDINDTINALMR